MRQVNKCFTFFEQIFKFLIEPMEKSRKIKILTNESGLKIIAYFKRHYPHLPRSLVEKWCRKGNVRIDGRRIKTSDILEANQEIRLPPIPEADSPSPALKYHPTKADLEIIRNSILFEDDQLLALNKPVGLSVQGGTSTHRHLDALLRAYFNDNSNVHPHLVHRLDKDTTGVLVIAKSVMAAQWLTRAFQQKQLQKTYWAIVVGTPKKLEGIIDLPIRKIQKGSIEKMEISEEGKTAITKYRVLEKVDQFCWLELIPETGRTHQLRVHCQAMGWPILGDGKYGGAVAQPFSKRVLMHLHARSLKIPYSDGAFQVIEAPLPSHIKETFERLGLKT